MGSQFILSNAVFFLVIQNIPINDDIDHPRGAEEFVTLGKIQRYVD